MMTNGDHEGQIFLSLPHTNNGFIFVPTLKISLSEYRKMEYFRVAKFSRFCPKNMRINIRVF